MFSGRNPGVVLTKLNYQCLCTDFGVQKWLSGVCRKAEPHRAVLWGGKVERSVKTQTGDMRPALGMGDGNIVLESDNETKVP